MPRGPYGMQHLEPRPRVEDPDKFATALHQAGHTYRSLATELDVAHSTLHDIGKGRTGVAPTFATRVEEALKVPPGFLFPPNQSTTPDTTSVDPERQHRDNHHQT